MHDMHAYVTKSQHTTGTRCLLLWQYQIVGDLFPYWGVLVYSSRPSMHVYYHHQNYVSHVAIQVVYTLPK